MEYLTFMCEKQAVFERDPPAVPHGTYVTAISLNWNAPPIFPEKERKFASASLFKGHTKLRLPAPRHLKGLPAHSQPRMIPVLRIVDPEAVLQL